MNKYNHHPYQRRDDDESIYDEKHAPSHEHPHPFSIIRGDSNSPANDASYAHGPYQSRAYGRLAE